MVKRVIKRDGKVEKFEIGKIINAIDKACNDGTIEIFYEDYLYDRIRAELFHADEELTVEEIHDIVIKGLKEYGCNKVADNYASYRNERNKIREKKSNIMKTIIELGKETDRDNGNVGNNFSAKLLRIASEANKWAMLAEMDKEMAKHHENGDYHIHDLDSFNLTVNCLHIPIAKLLENGFNTGYGTLNSPRRIESAAMLSCIMLQSAQNDQFGGVALPDFDIALAPYVELTREEERRFFIEAGMEVNEEYVENRTRYRVDQAMQSIICNLNTMHSRAGSQVPFSSLNVGIPRGKNEQEEKDSALICESIIKAYMKGMGKTEACIFPNIIFRTKEGVNLNPEDKYYYLFELACWSASKRMNPTFCSLDADINLPFYEKGVLIDIMGCRTRVADNINGEETPIGRGNIAPVTLNLVRLAIKAGKGNINKFFALLDYMLVESEKNLLYRYNVLKRLKVSDLPFNVGQQLMVGSEGLQPSDSIEPVLKQGSWAIGFLGLAECLTMLTGKHHGESKESLELGLRIVNRIREYCDGAKKRNQLNFSCYATPSEGLSGRFPIIDRAKYGIIEGVTDKDYYTNSCHVPVGFNISMKEKMEIEARFQPLCNGGHIAYIELDTYPTGKQIENIVSKTFKNNKGLDYMAINFHIKYCKNCGAYLEEHEDICECGCDDIQGISRITGYLALDERFGKGKKAERHDRVSHENGNRVYKSLD